MCDTVTYQASSLGQRKKKRRSIFSKEEQVQFKNKIAQLNRNSATDILEPTEEFEQEIE